MSEEFCLSLIHSLVFKQFCQIYRFLSLTHSFTHEFPYIDPFYYIGFRAPPGENER